MSLLFLCLLNFSWIPFSVLKSFSISLMRLLLVGLPSDTLQGFADVLDAFKAEYGLHAAVAAPLGTMPFTDAHAVVVKLCIRVVDAVFFVAHSDLTDECAHFVEWVAEHFRHFPKSYIALEADEFVVGFDLRFGFFEGKEGGLPFALFLNPTLGAGDGVVDLVTVGACAVAACLADAREDFARYPTLDGAGGRELRTEYEGVEARFVDEDLLTHLTCGTDLVLQLVFLVNMDVNVATAICIAEHICCVLAYHPRLSVNHDDADVAVVVVGECLDGVVEVGAVVLHSVILLCFVVFVITFCGDCLEYVEFFGWDDGWHDDSPLL